MKLFRIIFAFFIFFTSCSSKNHEVITARYDSGKTKVKHIYKNEINKTGTYLKRQYFEDGKLEAEGLYLKGKKTGEWKWFWNNGNLKDLAYFKNGFYINKRVHWFENGKLSSEEFLDFPIHEDSCCNDFTGKTIVYSKDGRKQEAWYSTGKVNGKLIEYYPNGNISFIAYFNNGNKVGEWVYYDSLGDITKTVNY